MRSSKVYTESLFIGNQSAHREKVRGRRQVLGRIIDAVKVIDKRGLSYRGMQSGAAYTLDDSSVHGSLINLL